MNNGFIPPASAIKNSYGYKGDNTAGFNFPTFGTLNYFSISGFVNCSTRNYGIKYIPTMERIIIDMDEVIADPMGDMIDWYSKQYEQQVNHHQMLVGSWLKGFPEEHQQLVMERLLSPGFFRNLPVMKDSVDVIRELN